MRSRFFTDDYLNLHEAGKTVLAHKLGFLGTGLVLVALIVVQAYAYAHCVFARLRRDMANKNNKS